MKLPKKLHDLKFPKSKENKEKKERKPLKIALPIKKKGEKAVKEKKPKTKGISLFAALISCSLIPLLISVLVMSIVSNSVIQGNLEEAEENTLKIVANNLASYCLDNEITAMNASDYYDYIDSLQSSGIEMAIIADGIPCTTSIKNENDFRIRDIEVSLNLGTDQALFENGYYDKNVKANEQEYYAYYTPIKQDGKIIAVAFAGQLKESVVGSIAKVRSLFIIIAVVLLLVSGILALVFSKHLTTLFARIGRRLRSLADGDLSKQRSFKSKIREISELVSAYDMAQEKLSATIGEVKNVSAELTTDITDVTAFSDESAQKAEQITQSVNDLTESAETMEQSVVTIHDQMQAIEQCVNDISDNADHLYKSAERMMRTNDEANAYLSEISENSETSVSAVETIAKQIRFTNESISRIDEAVELILSITEQTNLLSLNASIEAARAGEAGRGFSVVAQEIRKLAEQSASGAEMIRVLSQTITEQAEKSVELVDSVQASILAERETIEQTLSKYDEHSKDISQSVEEIQAIAEKTETLSVYKEQIAGNVETLKEISQANAENHEKVQDNVGQIIDSVQKVNGVCGKMGTNAGNLETSVDFFRIGSTEE